MLIKTKMRKYTFSDLENIKAGHSKVKDILHCDLKTPQGYLTNPLFSNKQSALLFNLRCQYGPEYGTRWWLVFSHLNGNILLLHL